MKVPDRFIVRPPRLYRMIYPRALWKINHCCSDKIVYLTFDDGPSPGTTLFILDCLDEVGFKATFFVVGENVVRYPHLIDEIKRRGHSLGNHSMHHLQGLKHSRERYLEDIENETALLGSNLFRPPHGLMKLSQYKFLKNRYRIVMFDLVTKDYDSSLGAEKIFSNVRKYTRNGSIIVFHDSAKAEKQLRESLPKALEWLKQQGYESRNISLD